MNWFALTILAILSRATYGVASKVFSNEVKVSAMTQAVIITGIPAILTILISPLIGGLKFNGMSSHIWLILAMIASQGIGNILFYKGLDKLEASTTQIVFSSILIWSILLSVLLLGSHFSIKQLVGLILLLAAIILVQYKKGALSWDPGAFLIIISAALFAIFQVTSAEIAKFMSAGGYLFLAYLGASLIVTLFYFKRVTKELASLVHVKGTAIKASLFASVTSLMYFAFAYSAYKFAPDRGIVVVLLTSQVVFSVILAIIFLKERGRIAQKLSAGALAVIAGLLIKS